MYLLFVSLLLLLAFIIIQNLDKKPCVSALIFVVGRRGPSGGSDIELSDRCLRLKQAGFCRYDWVERKCRQTCSGKDDHNQYLIFC